MRPRPLAPTVDPNDYARRMADAKERARRLREQRELTRGTGTSSGAAADDAGARPMPDREVAAPQPPSAYAATPPYAAAAHASRPAYRGMISFGGAGGDDCAGSSLQPPAAPFIRADALPTDADDAFMSGLRGGDTLRARGPPAAAAAAPPRGAQRPAWNSDVTVASAADGDSMGGDTLSGDGQEPRVAETDGQEPRVAETHAERLARMRATLRGAPAERATPVATKAYSGIALDTAAPESHPSTSSGFGGGSVLPPVVGAGRDPARRPPLSDDEFVAAAARVERDEAAQQQQQHGGAMRRGTATIAAADARGGGAGRALPAAPAAAHLLAFDERPVGRSGAAAMPDMADRDIDHRPSAGAPVPRASSKSAGAEPTSRVRPTINGGATASGDASGPSSASATSTAYSSTVTASPEGGDADALPPPQGRLTLLKAKLMRSSSAPQASPAAAATAQQLPAFNAAAVAYAQQQRAPAAAAALIRGGPPAPRQSPAAAAVTAAALPPLPRAPPTSAPRLSMRGSDNDDSYSHVHEGLGAPDSDYYSRGHGGASDASASRGTSTQTTYRGAPPDPPVTQQPQQPRRRGGGGDVPDGGGAASRRTAFPSGGDDDRPLSTAAARAAAASAPAAFHIVDDDEGGGAAFDSDGPHPGDDEDAEAEEGGGEEESGPRAPCPSCGRSFLEDRLAKHARVCAKVFMRKRAAFKVDKVPAEARALAAAQGGGGPGGRGKAATGKQPATVPAATAAGAAPTAWAAKSSALRDAMRAARQYKAAIAAGEDPPPPPAPSAPDPGLVPCDSCGRSFAPAAAERHIPKCAGIRAKPRALVRGTGLAGGTAAAAARSAAGAGRGAPPAPPATTFHDEWPDRAPAAVPQQRARPGATGAPPPPRGLATTATRGGAAPRVVSSPPQPVLPTATSRQPVGSSSSSLPRASRPSLGGGRGLGMPAAAPASSTMQPPRGALPARAPLMRAAASGLLDDPFVDTVDRRR